MSIRISYFFRTQIKGAFSAFKTDYLGNEFTTSIRLEFFSPENVSSTRALQANNEYFRRSGSEEGCRVTSFSPAMSDLFTSYDSVSNFAESDVSTPKTSYKKLAFTKCRKAGRALETLGFELM